MISIKNKREIAKNNILILGNFDAVHIGHMKIISNALSLAQKTGKEIYVLLFNSDYKKKLKRSNYASILNNKERVLKLKEAGIRKVFYLEFYEVRNLSKDKFIKEIIIETFSPSIVLFGDDYRFGKDALGDSKLLKKSLEKENIKAKSVNLYKRSGKKVSTEIIKEFLFKGDIKDASKLLGYEYFIEGCVVKGNQLGRTIGFNTANIKNADNKIIPQNGVYITKTIYKNRKYYSMTNIGTRPTVENKSERIVETNIFNFKKEIYGEEIKVIFIKRIRDEVKFQNIEDLKSQLIKDKGKIRKYFKI